MKVARKPKTCMNELLGKMSNARKESNQRLSTTSLLPFETRVYPVDPKD